MLSVVFPFMRFILLAIGDQILAKWISAFRVWYRQLTDPILKKKIDEEYDRMCGEWDAMQDDLRKAEEAARRRGTN